MVTDQSCTQAEFGSVVGISQQAVSDLVTRGVLPAGATLGQWIEAYCARLREQAAGRMGAQVGGLDLTQERAALALEQRRSLEIKNAVLRGEYAPISLLGEVLATASQAVSERFDHLPAQMRRACPGLPQPAIDAVMATIASARNQWVSGTVALLTSRLTSTDDDDSDEAGNAQAGHGEA